MRTLTRNLALLVIASTIASAQEEPANVDLCAISLDGRILDLKFTSSSRTESLNVFKGQRSETFRYVGPQTVRFFRETGEIGPEGNPIQTTVAEFKLPGKTGSYLLIMSQDPKNKERYRVFPLQDSWSDFPIGTYRFLNMAPFEIALKLDEEVFRIKALDFTDVRPSLDGSGHHQAIMISLPKDDNPIKIFEGYMYYTENARTLYIVSPRGGEREGRVSLLAVPQTTPES